MMNNSPKADESCNALSDKIKMDYGCNSKPTKEESSSENNKTVNIREEEIEIKLGMQEEIDY